MVGFCAMADSTYMTAPALLAPVTPLLIQLYGNELAQKYVIQSAVKATFEAGIWLGLRGRMKLGAN
jgi:hypothetical protein